MKDLNKATLRLISCFFITLVSCIEDNERVSTADLLSSVNDTGRSYYISTAEIDLADVNGILILDECVTDNTIIYYPNGRYEENEGRTKCNIDDPPGQIGSWSLINNDSQLFIQFGDVTQTWNIIDVDNNGHRLTRSTGEGEVTFVLTRFQ